MLSQDEQRQLARIENLTAVEDPGFADGLRTGEPRRPHEYRRWPAVLLIGVGVVCLLLAVVSGNWLPAVLGALALPAGGALSPSRRLDRPRPKRPRRRRRRR